MIKTIQQCINENDEIKHNKINIIPATKITDIFTDISARFLIYELDRLTDISAQYFHRKKTKEKAKSLQVVNNDTIQQIYS